MIKQIISYLNADEKCKPLIYILFKITLILVKENLWVGQMLETLLSLEKENFNFVEYLKIYPVSKKVLKFVKLLISLLVKQNSTLLLVCHTKIQNTSVHNNNNTVKRNLLLSSHCIMIFYL